MATEHEDRESIVARAIEIESAKERDAYIAQACGDDTELRQQVNEKVSEHFQAADREDSDGSNDGNKPVHERGSKQNRAGHTESREQPLTRIGPYKVLKLLGEEVEGTVYQAEQQEPIRRPVALRTIKEGLDWRQILARLEVARPVLTRMDHPNIAPLLDLGTRQSGQPYLVSEWVEGSSITRYSDEQKLPLPKRLELFVAVCQAVQYAHQKGVFHGNLEPSKVRITKADDNPVPRVLDFGVAPAVGWKPATNASATEPGELEGKAEYMSPEQADANTWDIDARSDIYGLGILLYELLTGTTPLKADRVKDVPGTKALQLVRDAEIPPPSKRLTELKDRQSSSAEQPKALQGELDCVVMKALQKDPARRYATANDLAWDIQRYLAHEPIEACPPSTTARLRMLARKHPRVSTAVAIVLLLLLTGAVAGTTLALWAFHKEGQARKAEQEADEKQQKAEKEEAKAKGKLQQVEEKQKATARERDEAQAAERTLRRSEEDMKAVLAFFKDKLLSAGRSSDTPLTEAFWSGVQGQGKEVTLRKAVDAATAKVGEVFADRPLAEAAARELLGLAYLNLGEAAQAVPQYERALALREAMQGANASDTADCRNKLAIAYRLAGRATEAGRLFEQNPNTPAHASALAVRGMLLLAQKKPAEAELALRQCLTIREKNRPDDWITFATRSLLGEALLEQKKYAEAEPYLVSGYEGLKKRESDIPPPDKSHLTRARERLVQLYVAWGKKDEAAKWQKEVGTVTSPSNP